MILAQPNQLRGPVRIALIGAGAIAQTHAQCLRNLPDSDLLAVVDPRQEAASALAELTGAKVFASTQELFAANLELDALLICTPPQTHESIALTGIERGLHILCEKPLTLDLASARRLIYAAEEKGVLFAMASKFRHTADVIQAKAIISSGLLGEIISFENVFASRVEMSNRWNSKSTISGGGVLIDNGAHSVDLCRYLFGPISEIHVMEGRRSQKIDVEDHVHAMVRTAGGLVGSFELSWSIHKETEHYVGVFGKAGTLFIGWKESKYRLHGQPDWTIFGKGYDKHASFSSLLCNFIAAIRNEQPLLMTPADSEASVAVIEAGYRSLRQPRWVSVEKMESRRRPMESAGVGS